MSSSSGTFLISCFGQLEYINTLSCPGNLWHCKYEIITGPDWKIIGGLEAGLTQNSTIRKNGDKIILNFPIEVVFKSTNIYGWPQIILSVYNNMQLEGYGRLHLPLSPGNHKLIIKLMKPIATSLLGYIGSFFGYQPELLQPKMLATTAGNYLIRMVSNGEIFINICIIMQGIHNLGYDFGKSFKKD